MALQKCYVEFCKHYGKRGANFMTGRYKMAGKVIGVGSLYNEVHELCREYVCEEALDFTVQIAQRDIDFEREKSAKENIAQGEAVISYPDAYLETLAVYRKIADEMIKYDTLLFHGSVVAVDGVGYLFTAKSGTGKSTHTRLWRQLFGERAVMINDDKPLIKVTDEEAVVYGTPWNGKHRLGTNACVPLKAICVLERAADNHIEKVDNKSVYSMLLQQTYRPGEPQLMMKMLPLVDKLAASVELYRLGCNMDIEAARVAYDGMQ